MSRRVWRVLQHVALVLFVVFLGFPLLFLVTASFKTQQELQSPDPQLLPAQWNLDNFVGVSGLALALCTYITASRHFDYDES